MFSDEETSAIQAAVGGGDPYSWCQLMAILARCNPTDLDADAIFDVVKAAESPGLPKEVNALRSLDAAGALVRAQYAFSDRSSTEFEERFANARQLLATQVAQAGFDTTDPVSKARTLRTLASTPKGCALVAIVPALVIAMIGGIVFFSIREVTDTVKLAIPDVDKLIEDAGSVPTTPELGLPFAAPGLADFELWRAIVEPGETCTYGVAVTGQGPAIEEATVADPATKRSVVARVQNNQSLYAQGCDFTLAVASPLTDDRPDGDLVVGIDIDSGEATLSAAGDSCQAVLRRYSAIGILIENEATVADGDSKAMTLALSDGEPLVLNVVGCSVDIDG